jgi:membrane protease YdiL (CAAX protease family)
MSLKQLVERHPVLAYFALVYAIAWGGILLIAQALAGSKQADSTALVAIVGLPMLVAPGIAGITVTALADGRAGLRAMLARMLRWQAEPRWYAVALATMPLLLLAILYTLALLRAPAFAPRFLAIGLAGILPGYCEEIGWTGFVVPRLRPRYSLLAAGLLLGGLWGLWHAMADYVVRGDTLGWFWPITFALFVLPLTAWRILMVWVYDNTGSGIVAQLMHFGYTGSLMLFVPTLAREDDALVYAALAAALWFGVAIVAIGQRRAARLPQPRVGGLN